MRCMRGNVVLTQHIPLNSAELEEYHDYVSFEHIVFPVLLRFANYGAGG